MTPAELTEKLAELDPCGLVSKGANRAEYDGEAKEILQQVELAREVGGYVSVSDVELLCALVFARYFGDSKVKRQSFSVLAREILA